MIRKILFTKLIIILPLGILFLSACASAASEYMAEPSAPEVAREGGVYYDEEANNSVQISSTIPEAKRLVIKNADMTIVVLDPSQSMNDIAQMAESMGGFVVTANLYQRQLESGIEVPQASITIRVPAEQFDDAISNIRSQSDRMPISENINSQDVTREYIDLQSRLRNLEATEAQLVKIMDEARRTEDVLSVYNELVQIREQIEVIKGQIQYYEQSAILSAISVELLANEAVQPLTIGSWQPVGVAKLAVQTLINTLKFLVNAAIWILLYVLPVLLVIFVIFFLPLYLVWRVYRRRRDKRKENAPTTQTPTESIDE
ncbi:MAG: DUF4349 domain-containing protein [Anaerolineales bacterium]|nr:DUF4349 domain-containing protein [Anaerolineales bacterium]MCK5315603.1 DUF4349 domain-containing protein [Anaerolineales bacterium]